MTSVHRLETTRHKYTVKIGNIVFIMLSHCKEKLSQSQGNIKPRSSRARQGGQGVCTPTTGVGGDDNSLLPLGPDFDKGDNSCRINDYIMMKVRDMYGR